jgi:hypothetical protein
MPPRKPTDPRPPAPIVRYAPLVELPVYEITDAELDALASGPPGQLHPSFALALLPAALTILITLQTVDIPDNRIYYGYQIAFWLLSVQGLISLVRWWTANRNFRSWSSGFASGCLKSRAFPSKSPRSAPRTRRRRHPG